MPFVFLISDSITRRAPSLLAGSLGLVSQLSNGTISALRLPTLLLAALCFRSLCNTMRASLFVFLLGSLAAGSTSPTPGSYVSPLPLVRLTSMEIVGSPKFPGTPLCIRPALRPRQDLDALPCRRFDAAPGILTAKAPGTIILSRLNHTAFALAVYASCRHY